MRICLTQVMHVPGTDGNLILIEIGPEQFLNPHHWRPHLYHEGE